MTRVINKKIWLTGLYLAATTLASFGQGGTSVKAPEIITRLNVGDKVPDIEIKNVINSVSSTVRLSSYKGKLVLFDFWESTCTSCLKALPKIEKLQKKFADKIKVITVTRISTKEQVLAIPEKFPALKSFNLPTVIGDEKLYQYFPFTIISHVVWIGEDGIVKAITGTEHITEEYIQQILQGPVNWPVKNDLLDFDNNKPLLDFTHKNVTRPNKVYSSAFTGPIEGITGGTFIQEDTVSNTITINYLNHTLIGYCKGAITGELLGDLSLKDVILNVKDPSRFRPEENTKGYFWIGSGTATDIYCYSVTLPADLSQNALKEFTHEDIGKWLKFSQGITVKKEDRNLPCLNLVRINKDEKLLTSKGEDSPWDLSSPKKIFKNAPFLTIVHYLNSEEYDLPFVFDETGVQPDKKIDLELLINPTSSLEEIRRALHPYGLDLVETTRSRSMYVITEENMNKK